jgi:hypothetical protein
VLENPTDQILLLSHHPADASFLAEIAVSQRAQLVLAVDETDLIAKISHYRQNGTLSAVFVDVSSAEQLRKFEFELQSKLGSGPALEVARMVHFVSGEPLYANREVMQSPYFSTYSERKPYDFRASADFYARSFARIEEFGSILKMGFDAGSRDQAIEWMKKEMLSKGASIEWTLKFLKALDEVLEVSFPSRFDGSITFQDGALIISLSTKSHLDRESFRADRILETGVSVMVSAQSVILFIPVFLQPADAMKAFRFYKVFP